MNPQELGWVAGILEGEGCFMVKKNAISVSCGMTDVDTIIKLHLLVGGGNVQTPTPTKGGKTLYTWYLGMREEVVDLIIELRPLMSFRRTTRIDEMIAWNDEHPKGRPYINATDHGSTRMYNYYKCRCEVCREGMSAYRAAKKEGESHG